MAGKDPFVASIEAAVADQLKAGIDLISDGQVRADMVSTFAAGIPGMKSERGRSYITGKIGRPLKSITASDLILARQYACNETKVKGIITGPATLAASSSLSRNAPYKSSLDPFHVCLTIWQKPWSLKLNSLLARGQTLCRLMNRCFTI